MLDRTGQVWRAEDGTVFLVVAPPKPHVLGAAHPVLMLHLGPEAGREVQTEMHESTDSFYDGIGTFEERWERLT